MQYMLDNENIEPSKRDLRSPCIVVAKPDGTNCVLTVKKTCSYPILRIDDCIDKICQLIWPVEKVADKYN